MVRDKVRIRFGKSGPLRLVSHHDLMRCFERMLRRAALPFHSTQGFNPKPRLVFALSLALGVVGREEVVELELDDEIPPEEIHTRLAHQAPPGLTIHSVQRISPRAGAQVRRVCYRLALPAGRRAALADRIATMLAAPHCWIDRTRPQPRRLDIRPYLRGLQVVGDDLEMDLWVTPNGTARPDEVLALLDLADLLDDGAVLERTTLELHDEYTAAAGHDEDRVPVLAAAGPPCTRTDFTDAGGAAANDGCATVSAPHPQPEGNA
jgi:radical SAM-linked protein